jgi:hypothetical protein
MFTDTVQDSWNKPVHPVCPLQRISIKLKRLTRALQSMGQKQIGHVKSQLHMAREIMHRLEIAQDSRVLPTKKNGSEGRSRDVACTWLHLREQWPGSGLAFSHSVPQGW